jgi:hypothetical protein
MNHRRSIQFAPGTGRHAARRRFASAVAGPRAERSPDDLAPAEPGRQWLAPALLTSAAGVLVVSAAYAAGRDGRSWATAAYWGGHLLTFIPLAAYVLSKSTRTKWAAVGALALFQSLTTWMYSPLTFKFPDELQHRRTALDILQHKSLFHANPSLPVSPHFPGLEEITTALMSITGLSLFTSGQIVAGLAHVVVVVGVFVLLRRVTRDEWVAGVGALVFAISPHNQFFNAQWIYEVPAFAFMVVALVGATRRWSVPGLIVAFICLAAVTVTHHVTAVVTVITLFALGVGVSLQGRFKDEGRRLFGVGVVGAAMVAAWLIFRAPMTYEYLSGPVSGVFSGLVLQGSAGGKEAVGGAGVSPATTAATVVGTGTMALLVLGGAIAAWRRSRDALTRTLAVLGLGFFAILGVRVLAADGAELAGRLLTYGYLFACVAAAFALTQRWTRWRRMTGALALVAVVLVFVGNTTSGWPAPFEFVPGKFKVEGFESGVDPAGVQAARWVAANLPRKSKIACDWTACSLVGGYGPQSAYADVPGIFYTRSFDRRTRALLSDRGIDFVVVDRRITSQRPVRPGGHEYFDHETTAQKRMTPLPRWALDKFDRDPRVERVYDGGPLVVYDVRRLPGV